MITLDEFLPDIETELPMCPIPVVEMRLRECIIDACERANIWRWTHPEILVSKGVDTYELIGPTAESRVHSIVALCFQGADIHSRQAYEVLERGRIQLAAKPARSSSPVRTAIAPTDPVELAAWVLAAERPIRGLEPVVTIKPTRKAEEVSEVLYNDYYQLIRIGTLYRAWEMVGRDWSNEEKAIQFKRRYEQQLTRAKQQVNRGFVTGSQRITPRRFAASTSRGYV